jgi:hypothetical protein
VQNRILFLLLIFTSSVILNAQENEVEATIGENNLVIEDTTSGNTIDPLRPSRAAFYSAILPGLGQAYNKKYWKIPLVYAALGTGVYFYLDNDKEYNRYRDAYKRRLAGHTDDEFWGELAAPRISNDGLIRAQRTLRRNKEVSLLVTIGIYALNIIDANVDAHLLQFNVDENLTLKPHYQFNKIDAASNVGVTFNFNF